MSEPDENATDETALPSTNEVDEVSTQSPRIRPEMGQDDDPLPEWEELSPELMEDECIRGDFMLKWAVILLSVLLSWVYVTESISLVQIRTGEYITSHGFLPPATDVFSATATDKRWVNLSWLSDVALSLIHKAVGMPGLSVLCAASISAAFWFLSRISIQKVSTWGASLLGVLALLAIFPIIQPGPTAFTVLFLSAMLWLLFEWQQKPDSQVLWWLPLLFVLWSNTTETFIFGLGLAIAYIILNGLQQKQALLSWGLPLGVSAISGLLLHPFVLKPLSAISFAQTRATEARAYQGVHEHFSSLMYGMRYKEFWDEITYFELSAALLMIISLLTLLMNLKRLNWGLAAMWFLTNACAFLFGEWSCYAAIVNCAIAVISGQDWYRHQFSNEYRIDTWSVFVARAGRAITVLSFFGVAYVAINGVLMGSEGRRIGTGLDPRWRNRIESTSEVIQHAYSDRIFPLRPDQGDLLIWLGKQPFVDNRLALYASGEENLLAKHREVRGALFGQGERETWYDELQKYEITDAIARLWGRDPAYVPFTQLLVRPDWTMTGIGAAGANFTYLEEKNEEIREHIKQHQVGNFAATAFQQEDSDLMVSLTPTYPNPVTNYDRWLIQKLPVLSNHVQMARHYDEIRGRLLNFISPQQASALAHLTLRHARAERYQDANEPLTYRLISNAQMQLNQIEQEFTRLGGSTNVIPLRADLALHAAYHAVQASGGDPNDLVRLFQMQLNQQKLDLALESGQRFLEFDLTTQSPEDEEQLAEIEVLVEQLRAHVQQVKDQIATASEAGGDRSQLVAIALQANCYAMAISFIEEDLTKVAADPGLQLGYARLLLDSGRMQDALDQLEGMSQMMQQENIPPQMTPVVSEWRNLTALANLTAGDASRALELWDDSAQLFTNTALKSILHTPFASTMIPQQQVMNPTLTLQAAYTAITQLPERWASLQLQKGLVELQVGHNVTAKDLLEEILKEHPEFSMRGVVVFYLSMLNNKSYEFAPPSSYIPVWDGMFAEDDKEEPEPVPVAPVKKPEEKKTKTAPAQKPATTPPAPTSLPETID